MPTIKQAQMAGNKIEAPSLGAPPPGRAGGMSPGVAITPINIPPRSVTVGPTDAGIAAGARFGATGLSGATSGIVGGGVFGGQAAPNPTLMNRATRESVAKSQTYKGQQMAEQLAAEEQKLQEDLYAVNKMMVAEYNAALRASARGDRAAANAHRRKEAALARTYIGMQRRGRGGRGVRFDMGQRGRIAFGAAED